MVMRMPISCAGQSFQSRKRTDDTSEMWASTASFTQPFSCADGSLAASQQTGILAGESHSPSRSTYPSGASVCSVCVQADRGPRYDPTQRVQHPTIAQPNRISARLPERGFAKLIHIMQPDDETWHIVHH